MIGLNSTFENGDYLKDWPTKNIIKRIVKNSRHKVGQILEAYYFKDSKNIISKIQSISGQNIKNVEQIKVSIVIPVFNAENYILETINCCNSQTHKNIEIIVVNDGSNDGTLRAIEKVKNDNLIVITQKNAGPGIARNTGVKAATGEYLFFLDADDYIPVHAIKTLLLSVVNLDADFAIGKTLRNHLDQKNMRYFWMPDNYKNFRVSNLKIDKQLFKDTNVHNRMYSKIFWDKNNFTFENCLYEDKLISIDIWIAAKKVVIVNNYTYQWSVRGEGSSITNKVDLNNIMNRIYVINKILDKNISDELRKEIESFTIQQDFEIILKNWEKCNKEEKEILRNELSEIANRFNFHSSTNTFDKLLMVDNEE